MTVVNRLFGEDAGDSGPAKELPPLGAPLADLEKAATGPGISPAGGRPCHTGALAQFAQLAWVRLDVIGFG
jgi:hypothetical protein